MPGRRAVPPLLLAMLGIAGAAQAQSLDPDSIGHSVEGLPIARVEVVARNIYDPVPSGRLNGLYRLANTLHARTRDGTLRQYVLLRPGEPYREEDARETERILRRLEILRPQRLSAHREGDSVVVRVETRDTWSTSPEFNIENSTGEIFGSIGLVEKNLLGFGKRLGFSYREDPTGVSRSVSFGDPSVMGTRIRLELRAANGSEGANQSVSAGVPYFAQNATYSYGGSWGRSTSIARLWQDNEQVAEFDRRVERGEFWFGRGHKVDSRVVRVTGSFTTLDRRFGPSRVQPGAPEEFEGGEENLHLRRVALEVRVWQPHFVVKHWIEGMGDVEDFDLGQSIAIMGGYAPVFFGSTDDEGYLKARLEVAAQPHRSLFGWAGLEAESRIQDEPIETILRADGRAYLQQGPFQTSVIAAHAVAGLQVVRDFQVIIGGLNGLRAYPVNALAGQQAWRFNAEHRRMLARNWLQLVSFGAAGFYDLARTWGPGSASDEWHHDAGLGLRIALPRAGLDDVARIDVAWPISPSIDGRRDPVFSFGSRQAF